MLQAGFHGERRQSSCSTCGATGAHRRPRATHMIKLAGLQVRDAEHPLGRRRNRHHRPAAVKLEELLIGDDHRPTPHPRIMMARGPG